MEASDVVEPAEGESADGTPVAVGKTTKEKNEAHQPIAEDGDGHGTVTPRSAADPSTQSGDPLDESTKAGLGLGGKVPAQGGKESV